MTDPRKKPPEERTSSESVRVIYAREDASTSALAAIKRVIDPFADPIERKLILDAIERGIHALRTDGGLW